jgi:D-lactate dehydrogenase (cytochrome)
MPMALALPRADTRRARADVFAELARRYADRFTTDPSARAECGNRETWLPREIPDAVFSPESETEVAEVLRICGDHRVPVIPYGAGSSLEGQVNAPHGGLCMRFDRMARILKLHPRDLQAVVQPGATREALNDQLAELGLHFPVDPGSGATFGGMASTRASGTNTVRYGTIADNVVALRVALASGAIISTGSRAAKSATGYDLTRLFIGAEGTLGVIVELTVRLWPVPDATVCGNCGFATLEQACNAVAALIRSGHRPDRIELLDEASIAACNAHFGFDYAVSPTLFFEFSGSPAATSDALRAFGDIARDCGGANFSTGFSPEERAALWKARKNAWWAFRALRPAAEPVSTDVCVPLSRLADCIAASQDDIRRLKLMAPIIGHVGDGNFHALVLVDRADPDEVARAREFIHAVGLRAIAMGGTCSGEHGIGQGKAELFAAEHQGAASVMAAVKTALDPGNILNPGKLWQATQGSDAESLRRAG